MMYYTNKDGLYSIVATTSGPESIAISFEFRFPFWFDSLFDHCLQAPYLELPIFLAALFTLSHFWYIRPPNGFWLLVKIPAFATQFRMNESHHDTLLCVTVDNIMSLVNLANSASMKVLCKEQLLRINILMRYSQCMLLFLYIFSKVTKKDEAKHSSIGDYNMNQLKPWENKNLRLG